MTPPPEGQNLSVLTNDVQQYLDTDNVARPINFPLDTQGNPMLTGDASGLTNVPSTPPANYGTVVQFVGAVGGSDYTCISVGSSLIGFIDAGPINGDLLPDGFISALVGSMSETSTYLTQDGGNTWFTE